MRQSEIFSQTRRETPRDEEARNARLLIRAGYIHKEFAGVYSFLPLGLRVLRRIESLLRLEMASLGAREIFLSSLQARDPWELTGRWNEKVVDAWFKSKLKNGSDVAFAFTHEEPLTLIMRDHIHSWRDLPKSVFQIQTKFRNETRTKSGILRTREFLMKDLYSFSRDEGEHAAFYERVKEAYLRIIKACGIGNQTHITLASGGSFSQFSHEFQTLSDVGEDSIMICRGCGAAINEEIWSGKCLSCGAAVADSRRSIEVGNIFSLGTRFSDALGLKYMDESGIQRPAVMGSYGIGVGRLMGAVVEVLADERGLVWPRDITPFDVHLVEIRSEKPEVNQKAEMLYRYLRERGIEVLYDEREVSAGEKFADSDLLGIPKRVVVSEKTLREGTIEASDRASGKTTLLSLFEFEKLSWLERR